jgi:glutaredoxin
MDKITHHVAGKNKGSILLFALSTCAWCKKVKKLLNDLNVGYNYIDVDLLDKQTSEAVKKEQSKWNPACSFPTLVVNNSECIVGYEPERIMELLK